MSKELSPIFWTEYAKLYDKFTPKYQKEQLEYVAGFAKGTVLDIGTGVGKLLPYLAKNKKIKKVFGIDSNHQMLALALNKKRKLNLDIELSQININQGNPFANESLNSIIFINSLYPNSNPIYLLQQTSSMLKPNGKLIISDMPRKVHFEDLVDEVKKEFGEDPDLLRYFEMNQYLVGDLIPRTYCLEELESILTLLDFKIETKTGEFFKNSVNTIIGIKK